MTPEKKKIVIGIAAALAVAAVGYMVWTNVVTGNAAASADAGQGDFAGSLPTLLYASGGGSSNAVLPTGSTATDDATSESPAAESNDGAIAAALQGTLAAIHASANTSYNTTASDLFAKLPSEFLNQGLKTFTATQSQDADGKTTLDAKATYTPPSLTLTDYASLYDQPVGREWSSLEMRNINASYQKYLSQLRATV